MNFLPSPIKFVVVAFVMISWLSIAGCPPLYLLEYPLRHNHTVKLIEAP